MYYNPEETGTLRIRATNSFMHLAKKILTPEALQSLIDELTLFPEKGVVIQGMSGIRKIRCSTGEN